MKTPQPDITALVTIVTASLLAACSPSDRPAEAQEGAAPAASARIEAPAGRYDVDRSHSNMSFSINHVGLSNYIARFTNYEVTLDLDPRNLADSSVAASVDPTSISVDYVDDYRALHPDSAFETWQEDLAQSDHFFNAGKYPKIEYRSTRVAQTGPGTLRIDGDLTLLGQTHPVTLSAEVVGSTENHLAYGGGAIGLSASGTFERSAFGMDYLLEPPLVGDTVTLRFNGEFRKAANDDAAPAAKE